MTASVVAIVAITAATLAIGSWSVRVARTTSDLFVASRAISPWWNAAAISGEYLSAASFLGIAGLLMKFGAAALWLPIGFTTGYLALLLFVAAPLRRFRTHTVADFAETRLGSAAMRPLAAAVVLLICVLYLVPQLKGAGLTLNEVTGAPYALGVLVVAAIVAFNVGLGGMRGITYVQAMQYAVKAFAISVPIILLLIHLGGLPARERLFGHDALRAGPRGLTVHLEESRRVHFTATAVYVVNGEPRNAYKGDDVTLPAGTLVLPPRQRIPMALGVDARVGAEWALPVSRHGRASPLLVYSLLIATFLGTMGLPHIVLRFYTSPDGPAARQTTVCVLLLVGVFYLFPVLFGLLGRVLLPQLLVTGDTDSAVLRLPHEAWDGWPGELLAAIVAAGAFAAFLSTASGVLVAVAGALSFDVPEALRRGPRPPDPHTRQRWFRLAAPGGVVVPALLALGAQNIDISLMVGWAFAVAASTFCPLLLLGVWWDGLTMRGAAAGMIVGAVSATVGIAIGLASSAPVADVLGALTTQPAVVSVPLAFVTMIGVSLADRHKVLGVEGHMAALHGPEGLGLRELARMARSAP